MIDELVELIRRGVEELPVEVEEIIEEALDKEDNKMARLHLENILKNIKLAREFEAPMCQDTGVPLFYVSPGRNHDKKEIEGEIKAAVKKATKEIPLRPNMVDPISRKNSGDNSGQKMPFIEWEFTGEKYTEITYIPKGAGSENVSGLKMLKPGEGVEGIKKFVTETVIDAGGKPCPPVIVGVGIGGSFDIAPRLAKKSLLRPLNQGHKRKELNKLEGDILQNINSRGKGPMGTGGRTTALKVLIEEAACHTASLPVAVNIQCWAHRKAKLRIKRNKFEFL